MNARALRKFADQAARAGEKMRPAIVTIAGKSYDAEARDVFIEEETEDGGTVEEGEQTFLIRKAVLPDKPGVEQELKQKERLWWITGVEGDEEQDAVWTLKCELRN